MRSIALFLTVMLSSGSAQSAILTYDFEGTVTEVLDPAGHLQGQVSVGDRFSGAYTFAPQAPDALPTDPARGQYSTSISSLNVTTNALMLTGTGDNCYISIADGTTPGADYYGVNAIGFESNGYYVSEMVLGLQDSTGEAISGDHLLLDPPDLGAFDDHTLFLLARPIGGTEFFRIRGTFTSITPEPSSLAMVAAVAVLFVRKPTRATR